MVWRNVVGNCQLPFYANKEEEAKFSCPLFPRSDATLSLRVRPPIITIIAAREDDLTEEETETPKDPADMNLSALGRNIVT